MGCLTLAYHVIFAFNADFDLIRVSERWVEVLASITSHGTDHSLCLISAERDKNKMAKKALPVVCFDYIKAQMKDLISLCTLM